MDGKTNKKKRSLKSIMRRLNFKRNKNAGTS